MIAGVTVTDPALGWAAVTALTASTALIGLTARHLRVILAPG